MIANNINEIIFNIKNIDFEIGITAINNTNNILLSEINANDTYNHSIINSYFSQNSDILFNHKTSLNITNTTFDNNYGATLDYTIINDELNATILEIIITDSIFINYNNLITIFSILRDVCINPNGIDPNVYTNSTRNRSKWYRYKMELQCKKNTILLEIEVKH